MSRGSFATMKIHSEETEIALSFENGSSESYKLPYSPQQIQQQLSQMLAQPWIVFNLIDQTVVISTQKILKIEIKPGLAEFQAENVYPAEKVTSLQRGATGRFAQSSEY